MTKEKEWPSLKLSIAALTISLGGSGNYCFQMVLTNPAQQAFVHFLNSSYSASSDKTLSDAELATCWGTIVSILFWGTIVGAFLINSIVAKFGRKKGLTIANCMQVVALVLSLASLYRNDYLLYVSSRFLLGIFSCVSLGIGPMYILECSPDKCRGIISTSTALMGQLCIIAGAVLAMPSMWGNDAGLVKLYLAQLAETVVVVFVSFWFPESPVELDSRGHTLEAERSIKWYTGVSREEAKQLLDKTRAQSIAASGSSQTEKTLSLYEALRHSGTRCGILLGCVVMTAHIFSGIAVLQSFAVDILMNAGIPTEQAAIANVAILTTPLIAVLFSSIAVEKLGRRPLELLGVGIIIVLNIIVVVLLYSFERSRDVRLGWLMVTSSGLFAVVACASVIPLSFFLPSELVTAQARPAGQTATNLVLSVGRSIQLAVFLPMKEYLGSAVTFGVLFIPVMILVFVVLVWKLPETRVARAGPITLQATDESEEASRMI